MPSLNKFEKSIEKISEIFNEKLPTTLTQKN